MYFVELDAGSGELIAARMIPMQMRRFRLESVSAAAAKWLSNLLNQLGERFGTVLRLAEDYSLSLQ